MTKKQRARRRRTTALLILAMALLVGGAVGGTLAWLTDQPTALTNTFTVGNIDIDLDESANLDLKMIPGNTIAKDPYVTVAKGSEACWLFVKVEELNSFSTYMSYTIAGGWFSLGASYPDVFYRQVDAVPADAASDPTFYILAGDTAHPNGIVTVSQDVTKTQMDALAPLDHDDLPALTFTAYAVQQANLDSAVKAWQVMFPPSP